jgi:hypothetical protein
MVEDLENLGFAKCFLALFVAHGLDIDLLDDCVLFVRLALYKIGGSEGTRSESRDLLISFVLFLFDHIYLLN